MVNDEVKKEDNSTNTASMTDISKNTIIVLVVLTVVISVIGTFTVMYEMNNVKTVAEAPKSASANVRLSILPQGTLPEQPTESLSQSTGRVALNILPNSK